MTNLLCLATMTPGLAESWHLHPFTSMHFLRKYKGDWTIILQLSNGIFCAVEQFQNQKKVCSPSPSRSDRITCRPVFPQGVTLLLISEGIFNLRGPHYANLIPSNVHCIHRRPPHPCRIPSIHAIGMWVPITRPPKRLGCSEQPTRTNAHVN
jgi:hypothetical protein